MSLQKKQKMNLFKIKQKTKQNKNSLSLLKVNKTTEVENIKDEKLSLNKAINTVDKYTDYFIVFIFICLFWIKFINIYFSSS